MTTRKRKFLVAIDHFTILSFFYHLIFPFEQKGGESSMEEGIWWRPIIVQLPHNYTIYY